MSTTDHKAIRDYLMREAQGSGNVGKKMVLNPHTGKFEVASTYEADSRDVANITAEDMRSFAEVRCCAA
jgi:hypothetical protein